jgi:DNA-binding NarL/FixJ family response regulator
MSRNVVIIEDNMFFSSKFTPVLKNLGYTPKVISFVKPTTLEKIRELNPEIIIINIESRVNNPINLIQELKGENQNYKIVGYCGHGNINAMEQAKQAGIDLVVSNGVISSQLPQIINELTKNN